MILQPLLKGDPAETHYIRWLIAKSGVIARSTTMFVTSTDWGDIVKELDAQFGDALMDPEKPAPWHGNRPLAIGVAPNPVLTVVNAGTDDEAAVAKRNWETPGARDFLDRWHRLRKG